MPLASFKHEHRVIYAECTVGNHVYYGRYLELLENARGEFFRSIGFGLVTLQEQDTAFPVVECHLRFISPARYDDRLNIETWVTALGRVRLDFGYRIADLEGRPILEGTTRHVCTTLREKPKRLPAELAQGFQPFLIVALTTTRSA